MKQHAHKHPRAKSLSLRNKLSFTLSGLSFFLLFPGITLPMLNIGIQGPASARIPTFETNFFGIPHVTGTETERMGLHVLDAARSILNTVEHLWDKHLHFVAVMIFLFSVVVPVVKGLLLMFVFMSKNSTWRHNIFRFIESIGKWSMCDVFIVATFLAYLSSGASATHNTKNVSVLDYNIHIDVLLSMNAQLGVGFWYFLGYCLLSLFAMQLYEKY